MTQFQGPDMPELTTLVSYKIALTQNKLNAQASRILKQRTDLSLVEWRIIYFLMQEPAEATRTTLATRVLIDKGQLSRKISAMVKKGLVISDTDRDDLRKQRLSLTPKAIAAYDTVIPIMRKRQAVITEGVTADELEVFFRVLDRINTAAAMREIG